MNKKTMISLGVGAVLILGAGGLIAMNMKNDKVVVEKTAEGEVVTITDGDSEVNLSGVRKLEDLIAKGESLTCTFDYNAGVLRTKGKYFFDGKKGRWKMESVVTQDGKETQSFVLELPDYMYTWSDVDGTMVGYKFANDDEEDEMGDEFDDETESFEGMEYEGEDFVEKFKLSCKKWKVDEKMFVVPANINFQDMSIFNDMANQFEDYANQFSNQTEDFDMSDMMNMEDFDSED